MTEGCYWHLGCKGQGCLCTSRGAQHSPNVNSAALEQPWSMEWVESEVSVNGDMRDKIHYEMIHLSNKGNSNPKSTHKSI